MKLTNKRAAFYAVCGIVMAGSFCQYLYDALDDYGLRTNTLSKFVAAQNPETADHDYSGGSCNGVTILCGRFMKRIPIHEHKRTDDRGTISSDYYTMSGLIPNSYYYVTGTVDKCMKSTWTSNICDIYKEGTESLSANKSSSSSGDDTSGDNTSGDNTNGRH